MTGRLRKASLTLHVVSSVGWLGALLAFFALAIVGVTSDDVGLVRSVDRVGEALTLYAIAPLAVVSFVSGVVQGLRSKWGLLRYYWVVCKLGITVIATVVLLMYTQTVGHFADLAASDATLEQLRAPTFVLHSGAALILLLAATILAIFKPPGLTAYGRRRASEGA